jgi:antitoxin component of RelBE/YafQ-DinJ toxin-antitoxin module
MIENKIGNLSIRLDKNLLNKYKELCERNGLDMSKRLRLFIESEIRHDEKGENIINKLQS